MYLLSHFVAAELRGRPARVLAVALDYPGCGYETVGEPSPDAGRVCLRVLGDPPAALLADWRFPTVADDSVEAYRAALLASLAGWRDAWTVTVGGLTLAAGIESQRNFTTLVTAHQNVKERGFETDDSATWLIDAANIKRDLTVGKLLDLMAAYAGAVQAKMADYYALAASITAAQTWTDLDTITWN